MPMLTLSPGGEVSLKTLIKKMEIILQHLKEYMPNPSINLKFRNSTESCNFPHRIQ